MPVAIISRNPSTFNSIDAPDPSSYGSTKPQEVYDGGYENAKLQGVRLRIANGGAGQTGLIRAWADGFIQHMVSKGMPPFEVRPIPCVKNLVLVIDWNTFRMVMTGCVVYRGHYR